MRMIAATSRDYKSGPPQNPNHKKDIRPKNPRRIRIPRTANQKSTPHACRRSCRDAAGHADITKRNYAAGGARREKRRTSTAHLQRVASGCSTASTSA